jgi:hypothetical protein
MPNDQGEEKIKRSVEDAISRLDDDEPQAHGRGSEPPADFDTRGGPQTNGAADPQTVHKPRGYRFPLVRFKDLKLTTAARWVISGLIPQRSLVVFWGPPKCGKSFYVFDLVMHVALGWQYRGRRVEQGTVVYIAAEGEHGIQARAEAFRQAKITEDGADPPFYLLTTRLDLVNDLHELIANINAQLPDRRCAVLVIDTLNRTIHGSEKDNDMGAYRDAADRLRETFDCAVLIIHHCGVDGTRPRGHTSLTGALDVQLAVKRDTEKRILVTVELMKDGAEGAVIASRLEEVDLGLDDNDEPMSSCIVEAAPGDTPASTSLRPPKLSPANKIALDQLQKAITEVGETPPPSNHIPENTRAVSQNTWRRYCYAGQVSSSDSCDAKRQAFHRAASAILAANAAKQWEDWYGSPDRPRQAPSA